MNILFPPFCAGCKKEGKYLCEACLERIRPEIHFLQTAFGNTLSLYSYEEKNALAKIIHKWKYDFVTDAEKSIAMLIQTAFSYAAQNSYAASDIRKNFEESVLCPVPLHRKRSAWRGFNQAEHLALTASSIVKSLWNIEAPVIRLLQREKYTKPQVELSREERLSNVHDAFSLLPKMRNANEIIKIGGKKIILVDDIMTTGATLQSCAEAIKKASLKNTVSAFVLARPHS